MMKDWLKKFQVFVFLLFFNLIILSSCGVVEGVFKAGMWWAFFLVGVMVVITAIIVSKLRK